MFAVALTAITLLARQLPVIMAHVLLPFYVRRPSSLSEANCLPRVSVGSAFVHWPHTPWRYAARPISLTTFSSIILVAAQLSFVFLPKLFTISFIYDGTLLLMNGVRLGSTIGRLDVGMNLLSRTLAMIINDNDYRTDMWMANS